MLPKGQPQQIRSPRPLHRRQRTIHRVNSARPAGLTVVSPAAQAIVRSSISARVAGPGRAAGVCRTCGGSATARVHGSRARTGIGRTLGTLIRTRTAALVAGSALSTTAIRRTRGAGIRAAAPGARCSSGAGIRLRAIAACIPGAAAGVLISGPAPAAIVAGTAGADVLRAILALVVVTGGTAARVGGAFRAATVIVAGAVAGVCVTTLVRAGVRASMTVGAGVVRVAAGASIGGTHAVACVSGAGRTGATVIHPGRGTVVPRPCSARISAITGVVILVSGVSNFVQEEMSRRQEHRPK